MSNYELKCKDTDQTISKLHPPFIFGEGVSRSSRKNATCLDYKARYYLFNDHKKKLFLLDIVAIVTRCTDPLQLAHLKEVCSQHFHLGLWFPK